MSPVFQGISWIAAYLKYISLRKKDSFEYISQLKEDSFEYISLRKEDSFEYISLRKEDSFEYISLRKEESFEYISQHKEDNFEYISLRKEESFEYISLRKEDNFEYNFLKQKNMHFFVDIFAGHPLKTGTFFKYVSFGTCKKRKQNQASARVGGGGVRALFRLKCNFFFLFFLRIH